MRILKAVWIFIKWLLYAMVTMDARSRYDMGVTRGMHCYKTTDGFGYTDFHYDPLRKPFREYMTWKEFWLANGWQENQYWQFIKILKHARSVNHTNCRIFFQNKGELNSAINYLERRGYAYYGPMQPVNPGYYGLIDFTGGRIELTICIKEK